jgi:hypothetical protein
VNQVLTREEVAALLQGLAEAASDRRELGQAKQAKHPDNLYKTKANRKVKRCYLVGSRPRGPGGVAFPPSAGGGGDDNTTN